MKIIDAKGREIVAGSVLEDIETKERGVVTKVVKEGDYAPIIQSVGDLIIHLDYGRPLFPNMYSKFVHVPKADQTYTQRFISWLHAPGFEYDPEETERMSEDEAAAVNGILAILPDNAVDWEYGPFPDTLADTIKILTKYLEERKKEKDTKIKNLENQLN